MIHLLWPTVRPETMKLTYKHWMDTAKYKDKIKIKIAVNTLLQRHQLNEFEDIMIIGEKRKGPTLAVYRLGQSIMCDSPNDILVVVSDDFYSPANWDEWLYEKFKTWGDAILVNDGYQFGGCVTIPIMTYKCLLKLNRIIYHPSYMWQFSDAELYENLIALRLLKSFRSEKVLFEHRHWAMAKRKFDEHDRLGSAYGGQDLNNFSNRMKLKVEQRLK